MPISCAASATKRRRDVTVVSTRAAMPLKDSPRRPTSSPPATGARAPRSPAGHAVARLRERHHRPCDAAGDQRAGEGREADGERGRQDPGHGRAHQRVAAGRRPFGQLHVGAVPHVHGEGAAGARAASRAEQAVAQRVRQPVVVATVAVALPATEQRLGVERVGRPRVDDEGAVLRVHLHAGLGGERRRLGPRGEVLHRGERRRVRHDELGAGAQVGVLGLGVVVGEHAEEDAAEDDRGEQRHARVGQREPPSEGASAHRDAYVASRYPMPGTVRTTEGLLGSCSIFSRSRRMWTLTVLSS